MNLDDVSIWVIDSSALIEAKSIVSISNQWNAFRYLERMVADGKIALPRHVISEVSEITHPDMPGAWASGVRDLLQHPLQADYDYLARVMSVAGDVVDANKTREDADPWVLALALQLQETTLFKICIVTEDTVDRHRISMVTACSRLQLEWCRVRDFLGHCSIEMRRE